MKNFRLLLIIFLGLVLSNACSKDADEDGKLTGTWLVTKVEGQQFVNGNPGINLQDNNPSGYIKFNANGTGEQNYTYSLFGNNYPQQANFIYTATADEIIIKRNGNDDLHWERVINTNSKQVASYDIVVNSSSSIKYTLTLEK